MEPYHMCFLFCFVSFRFFVPDFSCAAMSVRLVPRVCVNSRPSSVAGPNSRVWLSYPFSPSPTHRHLGCSQCLALMAKTLQTLWRVSFGGQKLSCLWGICWKVDLLGLNSRCVASLSGSCPSVLFKVGGANPILWVRRSDWSTSSSAFPKVGYSGV